MDSMQASDPRKQPPIAAAHVSADVQPGGWSLTRIRLVLIGTYLLLLAVMGAAIVKLNGDEHEQAIEDGRRQTVTTARILTEHLVRTFGEVNQLLLDIAEDIVAAGGLERVDAARTHNILVRRKAALPQAVAVGTVYSDGLSHAISLAHPSPPVRFEKTDVFKMVSGNDPGRMAVGGATRGPISGKWVFPVARRITLGDGRFGGIVGATLATAYFEQFYQELGLSEAQSIAVIHPDGRVLFRYPFEEKITVGSLASSPALLPENAGKASGTYIRPSPFDGHPRIIGYHWLPDRSFAILSTIRLDAALARADRSARRNWTTGALVALLFGAFFGMILRNLARQEESTLRRRATELALSESEAKYRALVENIPQRVFYKDLQLRFVAANQGFADDLGLPLADIIGRDDFELHSPAIAEKFRQSDLRVMATGQVEAFDEPFVRNGRSLTIHAVKAPVRDKTGAIGGVCGIYWDITEQLELQKRLKESEARLRAIFDNLEEGIIVADAQTRRHVMANPGFCRMLGYTEAELMALAPPDMHPPEARARLDTILENMARGIHGLVRDLPTRRKDGSIFLAAVSTTSFAVDGRLCFVGVFRDVTEIAQAREALARSESRLRDAERLAHLGNWELDLASNRLHWSDEAYRIFEVDPQAFGATYEAFLALIHPDDRDRVNAAWQQSVERHDLGAYDVTHRLLFPDGRIKHLRERVEKRHAEDGTLQLAFGTVQDITEQVLAEQEIRVLNETLERRVAERTEELARANRELESFSYSVSHDLRAPLRAINGFSRILQDSEEFALSAESRDLLGRIVRSSNRMGELIDDILDYSRASQKPLERKEVDLDRLARAAWDEHAAAHPAATLRLGRLGSAWGDAVTLRQVFDNLVGNALKYSSRRERPEIEIGAREAAGLKEIFVRDNGAGFDMQYAGKLFGMFQRMHTDKDFPGTGVGLAICKRIVERHGGNVRAEAAPDAGATFYFTLPRNA